jgi:hypothetical protein
MHALDSLCFNNSPLSPSAQISRGGGVGGFFRAKNAAEQQASSDFSHVHPSKSPAVSHPIYPSIGFTFLLLLQLFFFLLRLGRSPFVRSLAGCLSARSPLCYNFFDFPPESRFFSFASCTLSSPHLLHLEKSGLQLSAVATTPADAVTCTSLLGRLQRAGRRSLSHTQTPLTLTAPTSQHIDVGPARSPAMALEEFTGVSVARGSLVLCQEAAAFAIFQQPSRPQLQPEFFAQSGAAAPRQ